MSVATRGLLPEVYEARTAQLIFKEYNAEPLYYPQLLNVVPSNKAYEDWFEVTGLGTFRLKPEGTPITYDVPVQGPRRRVVHSTFALGFTATMEARQDAQYDVLDQQATDLGAAGREHQDIFAFGLPNDFFAGATYKLADPAGTDLAVCSASHGIWKPKVPGTTASNLINVALSTTGLELAMVTLRLTKTREDRFTNLQGKVLLVHPSKEHRVYELLNTVQKVDSNENNLNTMASSRTGIMGLSVPYMADQDDWFLFTDKSKHKFFYHARMDMDVDSGKDFQTRNTMNDAVYRGSLAAKDWRGVVGSNL